MSWVGKEKKDEEPCVTQRWGDNKRKVREREKEFKDRRWLRYIEKKRRVKERKKERKNSYKEKRKQMSTLISCVIMLGL